MRAVFDRWGDAMAVATAAAHVTGIRRRVYRDRVALNTWRIGEVAP